MEWLVIIVAVILVMVGYHHLMNCHTHIRHLEDMLQRMRHDLDVHIAQSRETRAADMPAPRQHSAAEPIVPPPPTSVSPSPPAAPPVEPHPTLKWRPVSTPVPSPAAAPVIVPPPPAPPFTAPLPEEPVVAPPTPARPRRTRADWEALIGGNLLNRIGIVALVIGVVLFLIFAYEHRELAPWLLILIGMGIGAGLLLIGAHFHRRDATVFAQGLIGGGVAILYGTVYLTYVPPYQYLSNGWALALLSLVTITAFQQAMRYNAFAIAVLGWAGGFLTPVLLTTSGIHVPEASRAFTLFSYIILLDAGLLAVLVKKDAWAILEPLTLLGTALIYAMWASHVHDAASAPGAMLFLVVAWGLFFALDVFRLARNIESFRTLRQLTSVFTAGGCALALYLLLHRFYPHLAGEGILLISMPYLVAATCIRQFRPHETVGETRCWLTGIVLLALATGLHYDGYPRVFAFAAEALLAAWGGTRTERPYIRTMGLIIFVLAAYSLFTTGGALGALPGAGLAFLLNVRCYAYLALIVALALAALIIRRWPTASSELTVTLLQYGWCILLFTLITVETNDLTAHMATKWSTGGPVDAPAISGMLLAVTWTVYALPMVMFALRRQSLPLLICGLSALLLGFLLLGWQGLTVASVAQFIPGLNYRALMLLCVFIALLIETGILQARLLQQRWAPAVLTLLHVQIAILGFELLTAETNDYCNKLIGNEQNLLGMATVQARFLVLAVLWTFYALPLVWQGIRKHAAALYYSGYAILTLGIIAAFRAGIGFAPMTNYHLLLNFRTAVLVLVLIGLFNHLRWLRPDLHEAHPWMPSVRTGLYLAIALLGFELLTVETFDYFSALALAHQETWLGIDRLRGQYLVLAALWVLYSLPLVWAGLRKASAPLLKCGYSILAAGVLASGIAGFAFTPIARYIPLLNVRAGVLALVLGALVYHLRRLRPPMEWALAARTVLHAAIAIVGWLLLTVELNDTFGWLVTRGMQTIGGMHPDFALNLVLAAAWTLYALPVVYLGFHRDSGAWRVIGITAFLLSVSLLAIAGYRFTPLAAFVPMLNFRVLAFALVIAGVLLHEQLWKRRRDQFAWVDFLVPLLQILACALIFELLTVECWDAVSRKIEEQVGSGANLVNLRSMLLSLVWVVYAVVLMIDGLRRRVRLLRYTALALFGLAIVKIFMFDLSFITMPYRIFCFIGLGLVLLLTSYLYQHFRAFINDTDVETAEPAITEDALPAEP